MKHFLHILALTLLWVSPLRVCAESVTFDFTTDEGLNALTQKQNNASTPTRIWNSKGSIDLRTYPNSELTLSVPVGKQIISISFDGNVKKHM